MKHNYFLSLGGLILLFSVFAGCNLYNPAEPIPSYIHIQQITLSTTAVEGSNSNKISDAWVYIDGKLVGCYELPATFPVLSEGTHELTIKAGIKVNGIAATRAPYPFYESYKQSVTLTRGATAYVSPHVTYVSGINWTNTWMEDFEQSGITMDTSASGSDVFMRHITASPGNDTVFEGDGAGVVNLDPTHTLFEGMSYDSFELPKGDSPVFLEFNYKSNYDFVIGMFAYSLGNNVKTKVLNFHGSPTWNKTYVYLSPTITASGNATQFRVFFGMLNALGASHPYLALDNIKLVHY